MLSMRFYNTGIMIDDYYFLKHNEMLSNPDILKSIQITLQGVLQYREYCEDRDDNCRPYPARVN